MFDGVAQLVGQDRLRRVLGETYLEETGLGGREGIQCLREKSNKNIILRYASESKQTINLLWGLGIYPSLLDNQFPME